MLIISRKEGESFYVDDLLITVASVDSKHIFLSAENRERIVQVGDYIGLKHSPWDIDMKIHALRTNPRVKKVVLGCEGPKSVVVLRKELVSD